MTETFTIPFPLQVAKGRKGVFKFRAIGVKQPVASVTFEEGTPGSAKYRVTVAGAGEQLKVFHDQFHYHKPQQIEAAIYLEAAITGEPLPSLGSAATK